MLNVVNTVVEYRIELNSSLHIVVKREDAYCNMATWTLKSVLMLDKRDEYFVDALDYEHEIGEYDVYSLDYVVDEKIKPFLRSFFADLFGAFVNDGAF